MVVCSLFLLGKLPMAGGYNPLCKVYYIPHMISARLVWGPLLKYAAVGVSCVAGREPLGFPYLC